MWNGKKVTGLPKVASTIIEITAEVDIFKQKKKHDTVLFKGIKFWIFQAKSCHWYDFRNLIGLTAYLWFDRLEYGDVCTLCPLSTGIKNLPLFSCCLLAYFCMFFLLERKSRSKNNNICQPSLYIWLTFIIKNSSTNQSLRIFLWLFFYIKPYFCYSISNVYSFKLLL